MAFKPRCVKRVLYHTPATTSCEATFVVEVSSLRVVGDKAAFQVPSIIVDNLDLSRKINSKGDHFNNLN